MTALEINVYELVIILLAVGLVYLILTARERRWARNALLALRIVPALYLAVEGGTELLTYDETYMFREVTSLKSVLPWEWALYNYRTTTAITVNIFGLL